MYYKSLLDAALIWQHLSLRKTLKLNANDTCKITLFTQYNPTRNVCYTNDCSAAIIKTNWLYIAIAYTLEAMSFLHRHTHTHTDRHRHRHRQRQRQTTSEDINSAPAVRTDRQTAVHCHITADLPPHASRCPRIICPPLFITPHCLHRPGDKRYRVNVNSSLK